MTDTSLDDLISELRQGGRRRDAAVGRLFKELGTDMRRSFVRDGIPADHADDLLQDTLIKLVDKADQYRGEGTAAAWIWTIARNTANDWWRRRYDREAREVAVNEDQWEYIEAQAAAPPPPPPPGQSADECVAVAVDQFRRAFPERAQVLTWALDGEDQTTIAERIGRTVGATKVYMFECRKKLAPYLECCRELLSA